MNLQESNTQVGIIPYKLKENNPLREIISYELKSDNSLISQIILLEKLFHITLS